MSGSPLEFKVNKDFIQAGRLFLELLEDLESDYNDAQISLLNLIEDFPLDDSQRKLLISIILQSSIFTENKKKLLRKRILDKVNTFVREFDEEFKKYKVTL